MRLATNADIDINRIVKDKLLKNNKCGINKNMNFKYLLFA